MLLVVQRLRLPGMGRVSYTLLGMTACLSGRRRRIWPTYRVMEHYDETLADIKHDIELNFDCSRAIAERGAAYRQIERYGEALADYDRAIELNPSENDRGAERAEVRRLMKTALRQTTGITHIQM